MVDYTVRRYSKDLQFLIDSVLCSVYNADQFYHYYDISYLTENFNKLEHFVNDIVVFPGFEVKWNDYHEYLDELLVPCTAISMSGKARHWYIFKYRLQRKLKFKLDLIRYLEVLRAVVAYMVAKYTD